MKEHIGLVHNQFAIALNRTEDSYYRINHVANRDQRYKERYLHKPDQAHSQMGQSLRLRQLLDFIKSEQC